MFNDDECVERKLFRALVHIRLRLAAGAGSYMGSAEQVEARSFLSIKKKWAKLPYRLSEIE